MSLSWLAGCQSCFCARGSFSPRAAPLQLKPTTVGGSHPGPGLHLQGGTTAGAFHKHPKLSMAKSSSDPSEAFHPASGNVMFRAETREPLPGLPRPCTQTFTKHSCSPLDFTHFPFSSLAPLQSHCPWSTTYVFSEWNDRGVSYQSPSPAASRLTT